MHFVTTREHEETERNTEGVGCDMSLSLKLFLVSGSLFRDVRTDYNLDLRILVNFNDNCGFVVGTQTFFVGIQEVSVFRGIQDISARRLRKELINHNLYLFA